jgi:hypothetical protein
VRYYYADTLAAILGDEELAMLGAEELAMLGDEELLGTKLGRADGDRATSSW